MAGWEEHFPLGLQPLDKLFLESSLAFYSAAGVVLPVFCDLLVTPVILYSGSLGHSGFETAFPSLK